MSRLDGREENGSTYNARRPESREQELIKRDEQLREPATRRFIHRMERSVIWGNRPVSVFSLFRDGPELADSLRRARALPPAQKVEGLRTALDPYLQFVDDSASCKHTGLRLMDIWRYFRHTWSNQYTSTPGRRMAFLVRDRARNFHPIMGIGAIGSPYRADPGARRMDRLGC